MHRRLGLLAILYGAVILSYRIAVDQRAFPDTNPRWMLMLLIALVILWLLWPVVLLVHPGRSLLRVVIPVATSFALWWPFPRIPPFTALRIGEMPVTTYGFASYYVGYLRGTLAARQEIRADRLVLEDFGFGTNWPGYYREVSARIPNLELRRIGNCMLTDGLFGHVKAHNKIARAEIEKRYGRQTLDELRWYQTTPFDQE